LFLAGRLDDTLDTHDPTSSVLALDRGFGMTNALAPVTVKNVYHSSVELYSAEVQQIAVLGRQSLIVGFRGQWGSQRVSDQVSDPNGDYLILLGLENPVSDQHGDVSSSIESMYAYDYFRLFDDFQLVGGVNYTIQDIPVNTTTAPVGPEKNHQERVSPKAGIIWTPSPTCNFRASYTKSLTGYGPGQSIRLEPTQVVGLIQTFRAPAPFALLGELNGADVETAEVKWEGRFNDTFLSLGGQRLAVSSDRQQGLFLSDENYDLPPSPGLIRQNVHFYDYGLDFSAHQLVGNEWSFGVRYRLDYAKLKQSYPEYPGLGVGGVETSSDWRGWLHTVGLSGLYRHPSGIFARADGTLIIQEREQQGSSEPSDTFWQVNLTAGYRFPMQRAEIAIGVLNLLDTNYRLDPINQYSDLPRSRTFYARLLINF